MSDGNCATDWDHRIIDAVSVALGGLIGGRDDIDRLRSQIEGGPSADKLKVSCEIAVAFIRWSQDLRRERNSLRELRGGVS